MHIKCLAWPLPHTLSSVNTYRDLILLGTLPETKLYRWWTMNGPEGSFLYTNWVRLTHQELEFARDKATNLLWWTREGSGRFQSSIRKLSAFLELKSKDRKDSLDGGAFTLREARDLVRTLSDCPWRFFYSTWRPSTEIQHWRDPVTQNFR